MKYVLSCFFLLHFVIPAWSQVEFAPQGAEWYYRFNPGYFMGNSSGGYSHVQYTGDTLLNGLMCKRICMTNFNYPSSSIDCSDIHNITFIYQKADSIFRYESYPSSHLRLLFKNNFQLGDTFQLDHGRQRVVREIKELIFNNTVVRRFRLDEIVTGDSSFIYDIFGPESGILEPLPGDAPADIYTLNLRCYGDANFSNVNLGSEACDAIPGSPKPDFRIQINPNPAHDKITLEFSGYLPEPPNIILWDALGRVVLEEQFVFGQHEINILNLPAGFYVLAAEVHSTIVEQKLVKY